MLFPQLFSSGSKWQVWLPPRTLALLGRNIQKSNYPEAGTRLFSYNCGNMVLSDLCLTFCVLILTQALFLLAVPPLGPLSLRAPASILTLSNLSRSSVVCFHAIPLVPSSICSGFLPPIYLRVHPLTHSLHCSIEKKKKQTNKKDKNHHPNQSSTLQQTQDLCVDIPLHGPICSLPNSMQTPSFIIHPLLLQIPMIKYLTLISLPVQILTHPASCQTIYCFIKPFQTLEKVHNCSLHLRLQKIKHEKSGLFSFLFLY